MTCKSWLATSIHDVGEVTTLILNVGEGTMDKRIISKPKSRSQKAVIMCLLLICPQWGSIFLRLVRFVNVCRQLKLFCRFNKYQADKQELLPAIDPGCKC